MLGLQTTILPTLTLNTQILMVLATIMVHHLQEDYLPNEDADMVISIHHKVKFRETIVLFFRKFSLEYFDT